jgi:hypothetical protein
VPSYRINKQKTKSKYRALRALSPRASRATCGRFAPSARALRALTSHASRGCPAPCGRVSCGGLLPPCNPPHGGAVTGRGHSGSCGSARPAQPARSLCSGAGPACAWCPARPAVGRRDFFPPSAPLPPTHGGFMCPAGTHSAHQPAPALGRPLGVTLRGVQPTWDSQPARARQRACWVSDFLLGGYRRARVCA